MRATAASTTGSSKVGVFDPVDEGFQVHGTVIGTVVPNPTRSALIGSSVASEDPGAGDYFRTLSDGQKRRALGRRTPSAEPMRP